ncbi:flagellar biosynthetic protein FliR [Microbacterium sp. 77mftsu3.1]|uniref:flagellar biosynthetic protein FliR n=1 Tax=Microbacterium sp. 77mftsu3.1 TaxID=1761802 RepID=UPI000379BE02|nr:flagellar biosynthetic protein FliR [Microbacterium sp. 77mftsu3.1]SDH36025.1 flagellar biosynthetic protein FliR [Microbacterium sp. 77mftsu3.1]
MYIPIDFVWLEATALAAVRITAFLVIAPPFSYGAFPMRIKAMLAVALSLTVGHVVAPGYESLGTAEFIGALVMQVIIGALLGFLVMVCFAAIQSAGNLIDTFGGFQLAQAFDPQMNTNGAQFTKLFQLTALVLLFTTNGYQLILAGLFRSFDAVSVTGAIDMSTPAALLIDTSAQMLVSSVQIAGPLCLVLFLADAGLGLITRVAPALNAFAMGFPVKILLTVLLAATVIAALPSIVAAIVDDAFGLMQGVFR